MEDLEERYAALVAELASPVRPAEELAVDADRLGGHTAGLQLLVTERLVPTQLRAELADGR